MYVILLLHIISIMFMNIRMDYLSIGSRIRKVRVQHGLKQDEFAEKISCNRHSLSRIESGKQPPPLEIMVALWTVYKVDSNWILNGVEPHPEDLDVDRLKADLCICQDRLTDKIQLLAMLRDLVDEKS